MRISEIKNSEIAEYLRLDEGENLSQIEAFRTAAIEYIKSYTGMNEKEIDSHEEFYPVFMVLVQDMHDNRSMYVKESNINKVVDSILGMHRKNLL